MPSPVIPASFCEAIPANNSDLCTKVSKFFGIAQLLCDFFTWFLDSDGAISTAVKNEIAASLIPTGSFIGSATTNMGDAWLLCNGQAVSRTTYAALFNAIGTRYGAGNGTTTFNVPNRGGRSGIGAGTGTGLTSRDINSFEVGEEGHIQTEAELAEHRHLVAGSTTNSTLLTSAEQVIDRTNDVVGLSQNYQLRGDPDIEAEFGRTSDTGSSQPFNVVHPCFVEYVFIKT